MEPSDTEQSVFATNLYQQAQQHRTQKQYEEARSLLIRVNLIRTRILGPEHPDTLLSLKELGDIYVAQAKRAEAETIYQRALTNCELVLGLDHSMTGQIFDALAMLYREWAHAVSIAHDQQTTGQDAAEIFRKLALLSMRLSRWEQAEEAYQQAVSISKKLMGEAHPTTIQWMQELAFLYTQQKKVNEAANLLKTTLDISEQATEQQQSDIVANLNNLAAIYIEQGKFEQAEQLLQQALNRSTDMPESAYPVVAMSLSNLAAVYLQQGQHQRAHPLLRSVLLLLEHTLGSEHPDVVTIRAQYQQLIQSREAQ